MSSSSYLFSVLVLTVDNLSCPIYTFSQRAQTTESDAVTLPQLRRPNSTGNGHELTLPPPPPHVGPRPPTNMDERRHISYDNGLGQMYRHQSYPPPLPTPLPPHPQPPPTPYDQNSMYPQPMGPDGPYPITTYTAASKRKSQRASQACESCRQLKAKCDEIKPCKNCTDKNINCQYSDPAPKQQDKATQDILDAMKSMLQSYEEKFTPGLEEVRSEIRELKGVIQTGSSHSMQGPPGLDDYVKEEPRAVTPQPIAEVDETPSSSAEDAIMNGALDPHSAARRMRALENEEENEEPPGSPVQPLPAPFPHNHTTPAGRLLMWPAVKKLVKPLLDREHIKYIENYPQRYEEHREELPLFGRGKGSSSRAADWDSKYEHMDILDDASAGDSQSSSGGTDCGPIGGLSPPSGYHPDLRAQDRAEGMLDFDQSKVHTYVDAYKKYIQNMHPLIPPSDLDAMIYTFLEQVSSKPGDTRKHLQVAAFTNRQERPTLPLFEREKKRKRSQTSHNVAIGPASKRMRLQSSVQHALVLLVLALGKICLWRDRKLPEPPGKEAGNSGPPLSRNDNIPSPSQGSPPSSPPFQSTAQAGLPSPKDQGRLGASRRSSVRASGVQAPTSAASPAPPKKNYEVIPGLEYFAYATNILGNHFGSYKLNYIQAHILACLYYGQLGRVVPSFRHIRFACSAMIDKLQPFMSRLSQKEARAAEALKHPGSYVDPESEKTAVRDAKLLVAFWSCCQLEGDILAELSLAPSGILQYEDMLPYPDLMVMREKLGFSDAVAFSYAAQLYLRKRLNRISGALYNPYNKPNAETQKEILDEVETDLGENSVLWLGEYKFHREDPPARDILSARIRAKFWGANVITYRPSIKMVLEYNNPQKEPEQAVPYEDAGNWVLVGDGARNPSDIDTVVFDNARKGVEAAIKSTMAFHGLEDKRFVITNVFGTAHAQWGNLVMLTAVYHDSLLGFYVDEGQLRQLLRKTIQWFEVVAQDSSSLAVDLRVLQGLEEGLPTKEQLERVRPTLVPPGSAPYDNLAMPPYASNGPTPFSGSSLGPITPGDLTQSQPTPMEY